MRNDWNWCKKIQLWALDAGLSGHHMMYLMDKVGLTDNLHSFDFLKEFTKVIVENIEWQKNHKNIEKIKLEKEKGKDTEDFLEILDFPWYKEMRDYWSLVDTEGERLGEVI